MIGPSPWWTRRISLHTVEDRLWMLAEVFDPGSLDARVVLVGFDGVDEVHDVGIESRVRETGISTTRSCSVTRR
jgi:hypothetical protein